MDDIDRRDGRGIGSPAVIGDHSIDAVILYERFKFCVFFSDTAE